MISVFAKDEDQPVVREFFELFKTPWEFFVGGNEVEALLCTQTEIPQTNAKLVLIYAGENQTNPSRTNTTLNYRGEKIPVYGNCATFGKNAGSGLKEDSSQSSALQKTAANGQTVIRIGYDLFSEIRHLLTKGQPEIHAEIPALELHIALLRDLILAAKIPLVEIPPIPAGHNFIACLTHDVDHVGIRNHKCDHTMFGFLYRATIGSALDVFRGRKTAAQLRKNWSAALSLPLVHFGLAEDFWHQFDRYVEIEKGLASTFFVVPNKGDSGEDVNGRRHLKRATEYDVDDIRDELKKLRANGNEIGLHGIDAWRDRDKGRAEKEKISRGNGAAETGVRMHWLYFNEQSPAILEAAGFDYDSTVGYNQTVGYRAGTTQVFKPLSVSKMLELPMHIMDTALFYPSYLNLSPKQAEKIVGELIQNSVQFGGVLTINWHDRSIAPERLWDDFYIKLLENLKAEGAWFPTASQAVAWFKKRRAATFEKIDGAVKIKLPARGGENLPELRLRIFKSAETAGKFTDAILQAEMETGLAA
jgi:peptidoglycan/xylan/chitin deacetylase (PgdA/CDA1 family)